MKVPLEIKQLSDIIKDSLPTKTLRVTGEVSQPKLFRGNMYLNLKDKYCNIKGIIWKSKYEQFKTDISDGDKIIVKGKLDYYGANGSVSYIIDKLVKHDGEGELYRLYAKYKKDFENKGYFCEDIKLPIPEKIEKILLLTSENGAAIQDFIYALDNNCSKLDYDIVDVPVQGNDCPKNIINRLNELDKIYDLVVITRGGGSFEDLFGFSQPELIEAVHNFNQPIISAIGHQVDTSLLDLIADCCCPTPSLAAQYIIDHNKKYLKQLEDKKEFVKDKLLEFYNKKNREINKCFERLNKIVLSFDRLQQSYQNDLLNQLNRYAYSLKELDLKVSALLNNNISQNYLIVDENDNEIKDYDNLIKRLDNVDDIIIKWNNKKIKIKYYEYTTL